ncbi:hypothetical protein NAL32_20540 [Chryseobacterium sp. Ch-15]|uniref:Uncharacterized protein n=1 Tax=Chryseobacterium muglaense TaxID=2893752 RepID=A0A9Q3UVN2_9FLAO|nr:hypothetical protein [Chryseobacterium muglaense]MBD3907088.1 hypothetical protein [Chryseobacterium muglaense]MBD3907095.1 hypothetical protein [Chryseobacterium muglaense]MCC9036538.1 hypothetical protein [Chryseobacterium muglaense]MCC9036545.1 hypothetical protein [Chryseobacterium muglaense]MCM2556775.1 hypothetical protein [Chryseobacterium muglaense]
MKKILVTICIFLSLILFSQQNMNKKIDPLFLDLDLSLTPEEMIRKSNLKFEYGVNQGVAWTGGNVKTFITKFKEHPLIESKINGGQIFIKQNDKELQSRSYEITERIDFQNSDDLVNEFYKLSSIYDENAFKSKNLITENNNHEIISQYNEILIKSGVNTSKLTIGYSLSNIHDQPTFLIISYKNIVQ